TPHLSPCRQAALCRLELREPAAFLLHQIELHTSDRLHRVEDPLPRRDPLSEQYPIPLVLGFGARRPVLEMDASDASRMSGDPGDRIGPGLEAGADVEIEVELRRGVR